MQRTICVQKRTAFFNFGFVGSARTTIVEDALFERAFGCVEDAIDETVVVVVVVVVNIFFCTVRVGAS